MIFNAVQRLLPERAAVIRVGLRDAIKFLASAPLVLVWGTPQAGEESCFTLFGWCPKDGACKGLRYNTHFTNPDWCPHCNRPFGYGAAFRKRYA